MNRLYFRYSLKCLLNILKFYRKLCATLVKLKIYKLFKPNQVDKIAKYQQRFAEFSNLIVVFKKQFNFLLHIKRQIKLWTNSKEFKEKYIDTNHPYPPLLNPNDINYESIPAELAWEMNLPLPPNYDLIIISGSNMGHNALLDFLTKCGAKRGKDHLPKDLQNIYMSFMIFL